MHRGLRITFAISKKMARERSVWLEIAEKADGSRNVFPRGPCANDLIEMIPNATMAHTCSTLARIAPPHLLSHCGSRRVELAYGLGPPDPRFLVTVRS
jgi:hypothetical protein